jgi:hypothetical protein
MGTHQSQLTNMIKKGGDSAWMAVKKRDRFKIDLGT